MSFKLIDTSTYQGEPNYFAVKEDGFLGAYIKTTDGSNGGFSDAQFQRNRVEIRKVNTQGDGFYRGFYHEAYGDGDPVKQAEQFISYIDDLQEGEILILVWGDYPTSTDPGEWCCKFIDRVRQRYINGLWIYMNRSQLDSHNWNGVLIDRGIPLIVSTLEGEPILGTEYNGHTLVMEQYSQTGNVKSIEGAVDLDEFKGDDALWKSLAYKPLVVVPPVSDVISYYMTVNAEVKVSFGSNKLIAMKEYTNYVSLHLDFSQTITLYELNETKGTQTIIATYTKPAKPNYPIPPTVPTSDPVTPVVTKLSLLQRIINFISNLFKRK